MPAYHAVARRPSGSRRAKTSNTHERAASGRAARRHHRQFVVVGQQGCVVETHTAYPIRMHCGHMVCDELLPVRRRWPNPRSPIHGLGWIASGSTIVWDDPVNLMRYVTFVFQKIFGIRRRANELMLQVHNEGKVSVSAGDRDRMETDALTARRRPVGHHAARHPTGPPVAAPTM